MKKKYLWSLGGLVISGVIPLAIACSPSETTEPIDSKPTESQPTDPVETPAVMPVVDNPVVSKLSKGDRPSSAVSSPLPITNPPLADHIEVITIGEPKLSHTSNLKALDTLLTETNYAGRGLDSTGDTRQMIKLTDPEYNSVKNETYEALNDYTIRITVKTNNPRLDLNGQTVPNQFIDTIGTAWVLDYEKNPNESYPLTWYYGTNLHVVVDMATGTPTKREAFGINYIKDTHTKDNIEFVALENYPTIFFSAQNFLSPTITLNRYNGEYEIDRDQYNYDTIKDYAKDFAVVKIVFKNEAEAKKLTHNFAEKYAEPKFKFGTSTLLDENAESLNTKSDIFMLGYPATSAYPVVNQRVGAINSNQGSTYSLINSKFLIRNNYGQILPGVADSMQIMSAGRTWNVFDNPDHTGRTSRMPLSLWWKDRYYDRFGLSFTANNGDLGEGSSGSLVVDSQNNVLGINWAKTDVGQGLIADTFTSPDLFTQDGKRVFYKYDLINGSENSLQTWSFKSLLKAELAKKPGTTSWLFGDNLNK